MRAILLAGVVASWLGCADDSSGAGDGGQPTQPPIARFNAPASVPVDVGQVPFPGDLYLDASGRIQLGKLPGSANAQFDAALHAAWPAVDGWGVSTGVFFVIDGAIDAATLGGAIHLYDLDSGQEIPVDVGYNDFRKTVAAVPTAGQVLAEAHRYGAVLTDAARAPGGIPLAASSDFVAIRGGRPADVRLARAFDAVRPALQAAAAQGIDAAHISAATAFRTQTIAAPLARLRSALDAAPPARITSVLKVVSPAELDGYLGHASNAEEGLDAPGGVQHAHIGLLIHATVTLASYTASAPGHEGLFQLDATGAPVQKGAFAVPFTLALPQTGCCTDLPLVVFQHGIGATRAEMFAVADGLAARGIATVAIDLPFHGSRSPMADDTRNNVTKMSCGQSPCDYLGDEHGLVSSIAFFNLAGDDPVVAYDPRSPRDNMRQAAADLMQLARALTAPNNLSVITAAPGAPAMLRFLPQVAFVGHSFGTFVGGILAAVDPKFAAFVLGSSGGGLIVPSLADSPNYGSQFNSFLENGFGIPGEFSTAGHDARFHPSLALYQGIIDAGDPLAYARYVVREPLNRGTPPHIMMTSSYRDESVPNQSSEPYGQAVGMTRVVLSLPTPGLRFAMLPSAPAPYRPASGPCAAFVQYHPSDHSLFTYTHGQYLYEESFPPFVPLPAAVPVQNPLPQAHRQAEAFLLDFFAGRTPAIIDPFPAP